MTTPSDHRDLVLPQHSAALLGVRVDDITPDALLDRMVAAVAGRQRLMVVNANAHLVNLARRRPWIVELFQSAEIAFCDGAGVQFATWFKTGRKPARHTPPQWIEPLARWLAAQGASAYWLGGRPGVAEEAGRRLQTATGMRTCRQHDGFFDKTPGSAGNEAVLADIASAGPDLLLLNMGMPVQERWLYDNWHRLDVPVVLTAGALVDHVAGRVRRPPAWVADAGLEWLVRLVIEPRRLWKRYVIGLPVFGFRLLAAEAMERARAVAGAAKRARIDG